MIVVIPKGLSSAVIKSQILEKFENDEPRYYSFGGKVIDEVSVGQLTAVWKEKRFTKVYTRSIWDFVFLYFVNLISNRNFILNFDFRGLISEESYLRNKSKLRRFILSGLEKFVYKKADMLSTVSNNLKDELLQRFGTREIIVVPCCVPKRLLKKKKTVDPNKDIINFCYVGSLSKWQGIDKAIKIYSTIEATEKVKLYVITSQVKEANALCIRFGLKNFECMYLERENIFAFLDNMDFGFLIRDDHIVNRTASPIKFAEYISRGVIPIMTKSVGDYSESAHGFSYIVTYETENLSFEDLKNLINESCYSKLYNFARRLSW